MSARKRVLPTLGLLPHQVAKQIGALGLAAALALAAGTAAAHAVVIGSSLQTQPVRAGTATEVVVQFNSSIEVGLSRVFLVSIGDVQRPLTIRTGKKRGQLLVDVPALAEGEYVLRYRVFAADGHLTEDLIRFRVAE